MNPLLRRPSGNGNQLHRQSNICLNVPCYPFTAGDLACLLWARDHHRHAHDAIVEAENRATDEPIIAANAFHGDARKIAEHFDVTVQYVLRVWNKSNPPTTAREFRRWFRDEQCDARLRANVYIRDCLANIRRRRERMEQERAERQAGEEAADVIAYGFEMQDRLAREAELRRSASGRGEGETCGSVAGNVRQETAAPQPTKRKKPAMQGGSLWA